MSDIHIIGTLSREDTIEEAAPAILVKMDVINM